MVHDLKQTRNPLLGKLSGHEAFLSSIVGDVETEVIFSGGFDNQVMAWDLNKMNRIARLRLETQLTQGSVNAMAYDPKTKRIYIGGENRFVCAVKLV
jgi:WD40 repeat protein